MTIRFLTSGESHGPALVAILEGIPAGLELSEDIINKELSRRQKGYGGGGRMKIEQDTVKIIAGIMAGKTIASPLAMLIQNKDHAKWQRRSIQPFTIPRPGHADLTGAIKYNFHDLRLALERASARETAARTAIGAVCKHLLAQFGIIVGGYVTSIGDVTAQLDGISLDERITLAESSDVRCPSTESSNNMRLLIENTIQEKDTLGGVVEIVALGVPPGLGSYIQWDRRLSARLGAALLSVPAIKGVEFGDGFKLAGLTGTHVQDAIYLEGDKIIRKTNHAGGMEGGISNGEPLVMRVVMKPIATTLTPQSSVDLASRTETFSQYERSDFCPLPRVVPVLEGMTAIVLADALLEKLGGDSMDEIQLRFESLRKASLSNIFMDNTPHIFWGGENQS